MAKIPVADKSTKEIINLNEKKHEAEALWEKILGDISKTSATKQMILGVSSGWITGFLAMRVGRPTALALGGGIMLLVIANDKGYIKIDWKKVNKNIDKVTDKVEEVVTGQQPTMIDKAERFVDKNITRVEKVIKEKHQTAKHWYSHFFKDDKIKMKEVHIFIISFVAGIGIGIGSS